MKKGVSFIWDGACQQAFEKIKTYLTHLLALIALILWKPFLIYVRAIDHSLGAHNNDQGHEKAIYYLSRIMIGAEHHYSPVKKECLVLVFAVQKMRHFL